jgi:hypothetical protein
MRTQPSIHETGTASNYAIFEKNGVNACTTGPSITTNGSNQYIVSVQSQSSGNLAAGSAAAFLSNNNATVFLGFKAEL